jgi:glycosyltransferase involved in cell wall biosynthesis
MVGTPRSYAIILTHNRPELLQQCIQAISPQVDGVLVIDNASDPPVKDEILDHLAPGDGAILRIPDQPPNLSALWNIGLDVADRENWQAEGPWYTALLCDDAIVPPGWFSAVTGAMRDTGAAAGCSNPWGQQHEPRVKTAPDSDLSGRMVGWAFVLDGSKGLRADERLQWWWCDSDLDLRAREAGGMVMAGGYPALNLRPNDFTITKPELGEQAGRDGETFASIWGYRPW